MSDIPPAGEAPPGLDLQQLQSLGPVPSGAIALSAVAVGLLLIAWLLIYLLIYLPRGTIG